MSASELALIAAILFALGVVLQQRGAMAAPSATSRGFLRSITTNPSWLGGAAAQLCGWVAQAVALDRGQLFVVQPIISLQIVFALPLGVVLTGQHVHRRQWLGAIAVVAGLAVFLAVSNPSAGRDSASSVTWVLAGLSVAIVAALLVAVGRRQHAVTKAAFLGAAAGVVFGFQAAVTKVFVKVVPDGIGAILHSPSTYAMIASAIVGFYLCQASLQVGVLAPAVATMNIATPATSMILGRVVFLEAPSRSTGGTIASLFALGVLACGLVAISGRNAGGKMRVSPSAGQTTL
jgi:drug/metabolite transporter (DMT)-like permease